MPIYRCPIKGCNRRLTSANMMYLHLMHAHELTEDEVVKMDFEADKYGSKVEEFLSRFDKIIDKRFVIELIDEMRRTYPRGYKSATFSQDVWFDMWFGEE
jgi:hypothetical protein